MDAQIKKEIGLEIGHVLFIDIVGYSKLLITEQSEQLQTLKEIVRATEQFRIAEAAGKLLRLPTGDGGALVFRTSPDAPVLCALEISKALKKSDGAMAQTAEARAARATRLAEISYDEVLADYAIVGAPEDVAERLLALRQEMGFSTLSMWMNPGGQIPNARVLKSMRLFAERVAPRLS